jgi:hypothetical protein
MKVYTVVWGHTRFLARQKKLWTRFCPQMQELVVVNNGPQHDAISEAARTLGLRSIRCPPLNRRLDHGSHTQALNHVLATESRQCDAGMFFIDFDLFPIRPFPAIAADIAGPPQDRPLGPNGAKIDYPWGGAMFLGANLIHREAIQTNRPGFDTGGGVSLYIEKYPETTIDWWPWTEVQPEDVPAGVSVTEANAFTFQVVRKTCLHFFRGSNWFKYPEPWFHAKEQFFDRWMEAI